MTLYGKDLFEVIFKPMVTTLEPEKVTTSPQKVTTIDKVTTKDKIATAKTIPHVKTVDELWKEKEYRIRHYGCGCIKKDSLLCSSHNRT